MKSGSLMEAMSRSDGIRRRGPGSVSYRSIHYDRRVSADALIVKPDA